MWSKNSESPSWSGIDRFLLSPDWKAQFPNVSLRRLPRILSDHFSPLLDCRVVVRSSRYFKFEKIWFKSEGFVEQVKQWWMSFSFQSSPSFILICKLEVLKTDMKK